MRPSRYMRPSHQAGLLLLAALAVGISYRYVDAWLARAVLDFLRSWNLSSLGTRRMPDLLLLFVCVATIVMWIDYFCLEKSGRKGETGKFLLLAATATPLAYFLKTFLQGVFGRGYTRSWLHNHGSFGFTWLRGDGGFPSGHMLVFTAFFAAVWYHFPRYRVPAVLAVLLLGAALILTDYHFLSDLIAGTCLGIFVTTLTGRAMEWMSATDGTEKRETS